MHGEDDEETSLRINISYFKQNFQENAIAQVSHSILNELIMIANRDRIVVSPCTNSKILKFSLLGK
jgi:hypothetical protein